MTPPNPSSPRVFVDTGAWFDYFVEASEASSGVDGWIEDPDVFLVTSSYVFDELVTLLQARIHRQAAVEAGRSLRDASITHFERVTADDEARAWRRYQERPAQGYSFTDCTSFIVMERLGMDQVLSTDRDFTKAGFANLLAG